MAVRAWQTQNQTSNPAKPTEKGSTPEQHPPWAPAALGRKAHSAPRQPSVASTRPCK